MNPATITTLKLDAQTLEAKAGHRSAEAAKTPGQGAGCTANKCLAQQIRKVLATHYASKYPVR